MSAAVAKAIAAPLRLCGTQKRYDHTSAATTLSANNKSQLTTKVLESLRATMNEVTPSIKKLYGQMTPNTQSGGCQNGRLSEKYQGELLLTQNPEPAAYATTKIMPRTADVIRHVSTK